MKCLQKEKSDSMLFSDEQNADSATRMDTESRIAGIASTTIVQRSPGKTWNGQRHDIQPSIFEESR